MATTRKNIQLQVLQCGGDWCDSWKAPKTLKACKAEADRINTLYFTATRVLVDGVEVYRVNPEFPEISYPGAVGAPARAVLARDAAQKVLIVVGYTAGAKKGRYERVSVPANTVELMHPVGAHISAADGNDYEVLAHCK